MARAEKSSRRSDEARSRAIAEALGALGYPGFAGAAEGGEAPKHDPAVVLLAALSCAHLDERVVAALPWLLLRYWELDWKWVLEEAGSRRAQNRLGYLVGLAMRVGATSAGNRQRLARLAAVEEDLFQMRLETEDTLCRRLAETDRRWLRQARPAEAREWNLLTDLSPRDLCYDGEL